MRLPAVLSAIVLAIALPHAARAAGPDLVTLGVGGSDVLKGARSAVDVRLEYRPAWSLVPVVEPLFQVRPFAGVEVTSRGAVWGGAGILVDVPIGDFVLTPSFGVGAYGEGNGKKLGSPLEFRSQFEAGYVFGDESRLTAAFSHISNAGVARRNPGTEALVIQYSLPFSALLGGSLFGR